MATKKKMLQAAAGNAGGEALDITDVFSTYLYEGNGSTQTITNGIDLAGEGGLVWGKTRSTSTNHYLYDTERGIYNLLASSATGAQASLTDRGVSAFNSDGFDIKGAFDQSNNTGQTYASWTFRKAPKFFDVVTYTGDGTAGRAIPHNLGSEVGTVVVKRTNNQGGWHAWHRSSPTGSLRLDTTAEAYPSSTTRFYFGDTVNVIPPTDSVFTVGSGSEVNNSGDSYVAYLFAHNDGDGEFGPSGDQDIIKCGSFTGSSATVNLGFEPEWILMKDTAGSSNWIIYDAMRGMTVAGTPQELYPNTSGPESIGGNFGHVSPSPTGFSVGSGYPVTYIYIAIRRGPLAPPESATEVFAIDTFGNATSSTPSFTSIFPVDMAVWRTKNSTNNTNNAARLISGKLLRTNLTDSESDLPQATFDFMDGYYNISASTDVNTLSWMWKRAPGFFDVVAYKGTGSLTPIGHNLGVAPELAIFKRRNDVQDWWVVQYPQDLSLRLNTTAAGTTADAPTYGAVTATTMVPYLNTNGLNYIAYLFATLAGVSKVGSYTGNGSSQTIDCGFTSGARFILVKRTDSTGDWYIWDTERGIVTGNDPHLSLNTTAAEVTSDDSIDPDNSGFIVNQVSATNINVSSASYIFYAIA